MKFRCIDACGAERFLTEGKVYDGENYDGRVSTVADDDVPCRFFESRFEIVEDK